VWKLEDPESAWGQREGSRAVSECKSTKVLGAPRMRAVNTEGKGYSQAVCQLDPEWAQLSELSCCSSLAQWIAPAFWR
jgi:hypothetical protein